jgi:hypothetical protein
MGLSGNVHVGQYLLFFRSLHIVALSNRPVKLHKPSVAVAQSQSDLVLLRKVTRTWHRAAVSERWNVEQRTMKVQSGGTIAVGWS